MQMMLKGEFNEFHIKCDTEEWDKEFPQINTSSFLVLSFLFSYVAEVLYDGTAHFPEVCQRS